jgi:hypothetical protein
MEVSYFLFLIDSGDGMLRKGRWIPQRGSYREIYENMPKWADRLKLIWILKRKTGKQEKRIAKDNID